MQLPQVRPPELQHDPIEDEAVPILPERVETRPRRRLLRKTTLPDARPRHLAAPALQPLDRAARKKRWRRYASWECLRRHGRRWVSEAVRADLEREYRHLSLPAQAVIDARLEAMATVCANQKRTKGQAANRCVGVLLTWNGSWGIGHAELGGLWDAPGLLDTARVDLAGWPLPDTLLDELEEVLRRLPRKLRVFWHPQWSASVEVCPSSRALPRLHLHLFLDLQGVCSRTRARVLGELQFRGAPPSHCVPSLILSLRARTLRVSTAHYYLQAPKEGLLRTRTTTPVHSEACVVAPGQIIELWRKRKLSDNHVQNELLRSRANAPHHLRMVRATIEEEAEARDAAAAAA